MKTLEGEYAIGDLCAAFDVSRSGFHRWRTAEPCERNRQDARISEGCAQYIGKAAALTADRAWWRLCVNAATAARPSAWRD